MLQVGFEPTISAGERPQTYALDRAATGIGNEEGEKVVAVHDKQRSGQNCTVVTRHKVHGIEELKIGEPRIKTDELSELDSFNLVVYT